MHSKLATLLSDIIISLEFLNATMNKQMTYESVIFFNEPDKTINENALCL